MGRGDDRVSSLPTLPRGEIDIHRAVARREVWRRPGGILVRETVVFRMPNGVLGAKTAAVAVNAFVRAVEAALFVAGPASIRQFGDIIEGIAQHP